MIEAIEMKRAEIAAACLRHNVAKLAVFGSAARERDYVAELSDADFLAEFGPWSGTDPLPAFAEDIENILRVPVDVLDWKALSASRNYLRRQSIFSDAETIFEA